MCHVDGLPKMERASGRLQLTELLHVGQLKSCCLFAWTLSSPQLMERNRLGILAWSQARLKLRCIK